MTTAAFTSIDFEYAGHYTEEGVWIRRDHNMCSLLIVEPFEDTTYDRLLGKICRKLKVDVSTAKLKITYTYKNVEENGLATSIVAIDEDEDVMLYLMRRKNGFASILHVEPLELGLRVGEDRSSRVVLRRDELESDGGDINEIISLNTESADRGLLENRPFEEVVEEAPEEEAPEAEEEQVVVYDHVFDMCDGVEIRQTFEGNEAVNLEWDDGINMIVGQEFETKKEVQDLIEVAGHTNCFSVSTKRSTKTLLWLGCGAAGCDWGLRLAKLKNSDLFTLRKYRKMHTCSRVGTSTSGKKMKGTPRLVASVLHADYPGQFNTPTPKSIIGLVQGRHGVKISYSTALRGKQAAANSVRGNPIESFERLPSYLHMLKQANPGTMTDMECDEESRFKYLFIALGACVEGFNSMRKVIIMDGTHIKTKYGGTLLFALAQDPDRHHYPIAFGVLHGNENHEGWEWFLERLKICVPDDPGLVFVTDRHNSIIEKVRHVYPKADHGYCIWHMGQNVRTRAYNTNKEEVVHRFRQLATVYTEREFLPLYHAFREKYPNVYAYLADTAYPNKWSRCYFPGERYNIDTTNCVESMNGLFREARRYSLLPMLDAIVEKIMEWFNKFRKMSVEVPRTQKLVPRINSELHTTIKDASTCQVEELNSFLREYRVTGRDGIGFLVDLRQKSCACGRFDIDKYPCVHATAAAMAYSRSEEEIHLHELCSPYYFIENWEAAYCRTIYPVPSFTHWDIPQDILDVKVLPPTYEVKKGRNKTARIPSEGEPRRKSRSSVASTTT